MKRSVLLTALGLALAVAACGDGSDPVASAPTTAATGVTSNAPPTTPTTTPPTTTPPPATLPTPTSQPAKSPNTSPITVPGEPGPIDAGLAPLIQMAVADLAGRLGVPESDITPIRGELVTWPDSSLGCPEPDMVYLQVLSDGAVILLEADDVVYRYHTGGNVTVPFLCEHPA